MIKIGFQVTDSAGFKDLISSEMSQLPKGWNSLV